MQEEAAARGLLELEDYTHEDFPDAVDFIETLWKDPGIEGGLCASLVLLF